MRRERRVRDQFVAGLSGLGLGEWYVIPDSPRIPPCVKCGTRHRTRFTVDRPYDSYWATPWGDGVRWLAIEFKQSPDLDWAIRNLKPKQHERLDQIERRGLAAWVVIGFAGRVPLGQRAARNRGRARVLETFGLRYWQIAHLRSRKVATLSVEWLRRNAVNLPRLPVPGKSGVAWDPRPLLDQSGRAPITGKAGRS